MWSKNAWDHVPPPPTHEPYIVASLTRQRSSPVPPTEQAQYHERPAKHWDRFYKTNTANFFKDRKWLGLEFPELAESVEADKGAVKIVEVGCGAGNAVFPILAANRNPGLELFAYDYSQQAVKLVQAQPMYNNSPIGSIHADVWDLSSPSSLPSGVQLGSVDIVIMIFVMSALHPEEWSCAVDNVYKILKPGGVILFRDYGRHDLTQLRFKEGRLLSENFYIRGDKTRVYFFDLSEFHLAPACRNLG
ncbi:S-adenosyl-L-methionine-dependent methyltransferase [Sistotremastrum suecicum HHB10207 ss-3]|uniref:S-adenosyl-L-methionine-dependent methyltransferase n=1 Tax=Sistotremastrum suecicum HHB10207 ss-3 TaxID=1314776 RepID=A0A166HW55_9AGAM|nr:S-adenosyl-L-methionine-dependent methyltransferase [Sistotremastrum suecicum HHB10207 ss-3]